jgi:hypothetical protein
MIEPFSFPDDDCNRAHGGGQTGVSSERKSRKIEKQKKATDTLGQPYGMEWATVG